ncbi:Aste57867_565 [Aphanomyces stellatus]|uniref:Aste57867_565 protein n=1 Tax=Aphanomyces stellatus TaxID=120398 RepID=A0A485K3A3_9STRA|nr:hypothetical protein As57867_000564 [Aphanomyces stellatus]VFT77790.1 Aste57867_565 [Aphanomyces stellatus]
MSAAAPPPPSPAPPTPSSSSGDLNIRITVRYHVPHDQSVHDVLVYFRTPQWINDISKHIVPFLKSRTDPSFIAQLPRATSSTPSSSSSSSAPTTNNQDECVICMRVLEDGASPAVALPCGHLFHTDCISTWLNIRNVCPSCVTVLGSAYTGRYSFRKVATKLLLHEFEGHDDVLHAAVGGTTVKATVDVLLAHAKDIAADGGAAETTPKFTCEMKSGYTTAQADRVDEANTSGGGTSS